MNILFIGQYAPDYLSICVLHGLISSGHNVVDIPYVDYNNGYEFEVYPHVGHLSLAMFSDLKPLGKAITITSPIQVPEEVKTNTSAPLLVKLRVPNSTGTEELTYKVR